MKRFVPVLLVHVLLVVLVMSLTSCAPTPTGSPSNNPNTTAKDEAANTLKPSLILLDQSGIETYGVYYFTNKYLQYCTVVADLYNNGVDSNSAPVIFCH